MIVGLGEGLQSTGLFSSQGVETRVGAGTIYSTKDGLMCLVPLQF